MIRPIAIGVGVVLGLVLWLALPGVSKRFRILLVGMLLAGNLAVLAPWETFLFVKTSRVVFLSTSGVFSIRDGLTYALDYKKGYRQEMHVSKRMETVMQDVLYLTRSHRLETFGAVVSVVTKEMQVHPIAIAELFLLKAGRAWYGTDTGRYETTF